MIRQLVEIVGGLNDFDISEMTFEINCAIPGSRPFCRLLDFPLAISMLSSYLQRHIPSRSLFIGESDLFRRVRPIEQGDWVQMLADMLAGGPGEPFRAIYVNPETAVELQALGADLRGAALIQIETPGDAVARLWPDIVEYHRFQP